MMLFMSSSPFFCVFRTISETFLLTERITQAPRAVCEIRATNVGILRQSDKRSRFCPLYLQLAVDYAQDITCRTHCPLSRRSIVARTVSDKTARLQLKLATKANVPQFFIALKRVITQPTRLPFEAATVMLIRIVYVIEWRQLWETNHSSQNSVTRSRKTPPRQEAQPRQRPSKTATPVFSSPRRRARSSSSVYERNPRGRHVGCSIPYVKPRTFLWSLARVR